VTTGLSGARTAAVVRTTRTVDAATGEALWELYGSAFHELRGRAASRHWLTPQEFRLEALDVRVLKHIAWRGDRPVGLCTVTTDLEAAPWVSPEFYARRYPLHAARRGIHYCNLALVHPEERGTNTFPLLLEALAEGVAADDGVLAADLCGYNIDTLTLHDRVTAAMRRAWGEVRPVELDRQVFLAWEPVPARPPASVAPAPRSEDPR
jgi:hypothetical protein